MTKCITTGLLQTKKEVLVQVNQGALAVATAARLLGITRQGLWKLRQSFAQHGNQALLGRKRGPKSWFRVHNRTPEWVEDQVAAVWQEHQVGPDRLLWILEDYHQDAFIHVSRATIYRILVRRRLLRPKTREDRKHTKLYTKGYPGEEVQMDTTEPFGKGNGIQISAIDDYSRWGFAQVYQGNSSHNASQFLLQIIWQAPFPVSCVRVDNGSEFKGEFKRTCDRLGIRLIRNPVKTPEYNGKVERFHRTIEEECLWRVRATPDDLILVNYQLNRYLSWYNTKRRHGGMGMHRRTPQQQIEHFIITHRAHPFTRDVNETLILYISFLSSPSALE